MTESRLVHLASPLGVTDLTAALEGPLQAFLANGVDSPHTRRAYERHVREAFMIMGIHRVAEVSAESLVRFRAVLLEDARGPATRAQALSDVRSFLQSKLFAFDLREEEERMSACSSARGCMMDSQRLVL